MSPVATILLACAFVALVAFVAGVFTGIRWLGSSQPAVKQCPGDTSLELIQSAQACVRQALDPLSCTLPWTRPRLDKALELLDQAERSESDSGWREEL